MVQAEIEAARPRGWLELAPDPPLREQIWNIVEISVLDANSAHCHLRKSSSSIDAAEIGPAVCTGPSLTIEEKSPNNTAASSWHFPRNWLTMGNVAEGFRANII